MTTEGSVVLGVNTNIYIHIVRKSRMLAGVEWNVHECQNILVVGVSPFCLSDSMHSSLHRLDKLVQILMTSVISA